MLKTLRNSLYLAGLLVLTAQLALQAKDQTQDQTQVSNQMLSGQEIIKIMEHSDRLKHTRPRVAVSLRRLAVEVAVFIDGNAQFNTFKTIKESAQELSDRLRKLIEKYELEKNVTVILFFPGCGVDDVTTDFIHTIFPCLVKEKGVDHG